MPEEFNPSPLAWLKRLRDTQEHEITCTECLELVSQFVDLELEIGEAAARLPQLAHHLNQCPACWDSHQILRELARLEAHEGLPDVADLAEQLKNDE